MAQQPNHPKHRGNTSTGRAIGFGLAAFAAGAFAFYVMPGLLSKDVNTHDTAFSGNPAQQEVHNRFDPAQDQAVEVRGGFQLLPEGRPVSLNKDQLSAIEVSREGYILYSRPPGQPQGGGGGIGPDQRRTGVPGLPQATGPVYVELPDGKFQRLVQR